MQKSSNQDTDGTVWQTASVPIGNVGLDLRRPDGAGALTELLNARFLDERTVCRRDGHTGRLVQDYSFPTQDKRITTDWVYGHGTVIDPSNNHDWENAHHPVHNRGRGTFVHEDAELVWTGDRLLVATNDGPFWGGSTHWSRIGNSNPSNQGIPCYLPVQTDATAPGTVSEEVATCLTESLRVIVQTNDSEGLTAWVLDRATGAVIDYSQIDSEGLHIRVIDSGGIPVVLYRKNSGVTISHWTGAAWSAPSEIDSDAEWYDVCPVPGGFHIALRVDDEILAGRYIGYHTSDVPYAFKTSLDLDSWVPTDELPIALSVSPTGELVAVWQGSNGSVDEDENLIVRLLARVYTDGAEPASDVKEVSEEFGWEVLTVCYRGLQNSEGHHPFLIFGALPSGAVHVFELSGNAVGLGYSLTIRQNGVRYNSQIAGNAFRVGDEVFAWLRATNSSTSYLVAGAAQPLVCGIADREETPEYTLTDSKRTYSFVQGDPADEMVKVWARPYDAGSYSRAGNARLGDINFLPRLSAARYGKSTYLAGSLVKCWDGVELGDTGFHDYPRTTGAETSGGTLTLTGTYRVRVYPVRYNHAGERFMGAALTSDPVTLTSTNQTINWTITTVPVTNHDDVIFEVYRTENGGTTYYYDGSVANDREAATVTYASAADFDITSLPPGDSHETGVSGADEIEEFGPIGCEILITAGDRMWGVGGQVPPGAAQFSKLYENGEGVGFDALAGSQLIDPSGGRLTSIAAFADSVIVAFQEAKFYVLSGSGPDNYGSGTFSIPQLVGTDGALNHEGTIVLPMGIAYWGVGGPRLLTQGFRVETICDPVRPLTDTMTPSCVLADLARREVVWYTDSGKAVLWNYAGLTRTFDSGATSTGSRWARWTGLPVAGCSPVSLVTTDGRLLTAADTTQDDGRRVVFRFATGDVSPEGIIGGSTLIRRVGMTAQYLGEHTPRFRVFYDGSPLWSEEFTWQPADQTWLTSGDIHEDLTPEEIDELIATDQSGGMSTHRRLRRLTCRHFRVEVSDLGREGFLPYGLTFELGARPGPGRVAVNTFGD